MTDLTVPLNNKIKMFAMLYVQNNFNLERAREEAEIDIQQARAIMTQKSVKKYIREFVEAAEQNCAISLGYKLRKLKLVIDTCIPDEEEQNPLKMKTGLTAIAELNKMQGHYSAEKHTVDNPAQNEALKAMHEITATLIEKYKKDY